MVDIGRTALVAMIAAFGAGAVLSALAPSPRAARLITALAASAGSLAGLVAAALVLGTRQPAAITWPGLVAPAGGVALRLDTLGAVFLGLVNAVGVPAAIYGVAYTAEYDGRRSLRAFGVFFNGFLCGMSLVPCADNVFTFLLAWELMAVASYFLVMTESHQVETRRASLWYAAMTHFGFVLLVPMFLLLAPGPSFTAFANLRTGAAALTSGARDGVFLLALAAFGSKAGLVPLHVWLPRAHPAAPSHVSALMSGAMIKLGVYGLLRVAVDLLGVGPAWWGGVVIAAASASALLGILYALAENDLKRLLAYSSIENVGIIFLAVGAGLVFESEGFRALALAAFAAALLHSVNHASFKALLFLAAGSVQQRTHTRNLEQLGGLAKRLPETAGLFLLGSVAAAALPPLNGFASEWTIFQALLAGVHLPRPEVALGAPLAIGVLALTSGLAAVCFVKAYGVGFLAMPRSDAAAEAREPHWSMRVPMWLLAGACALLGLGAPRVFGGMAGALEPVVPAFGITSSASAPPDWLWLRAPQDLTHTSPVLIASLLIVIPLAVLTVLRLRGLVVRRADTWGCGRIRQTPRMEYTASAFAEPLRRIFSELYRPTEDRSVVVHPDSPYVVRSISYSTHIAPRIEQAVYAPVLLAARTVAAQVRRLQAGSVHLYLLYLTGALMAALASAWWLR